MAVLDGQRYLVSMLGDNVQWVQNLRAAGGRAVLRSGGREDIQLEEIPADQRAPILRVYLQRAPGARPHVPVSKDAALAEFEKIAAAFPVFRVTSNKAVPPTPDVGMNSSAERFLRIAFLAGAVTDACALLPMLFPRFASLLWGFRDYSGNSRFAMGYGASLMLGWTLLLLWAYRRPFERSFVAPLTALVILGLILTEAVAVHSGVLEARRMVLTWFLQAFLLLFFALAYHRRSVRRHVSPQSSS
ncbi:MAG: hypothetical protein ACHQ6U_06700 [Thermodesulfobacteriota bacterium]